MLKNELTVGIILLFLLSSVISFASSNEVSSNNIIYVDDNGGADYTRIQDAIANASKGDTVFVYNGTYNEKVVINKPISLIGEDRNSTIIKFRLEGNLVKVTADGVTVSDFKVKNTELGDSIGIGVYSSNNIISGNIIHNGARYGIKVSNGNFNIINNNWISWGASTGAGISLINSYNNIVSDNNISGFFACMKFMQCDAGYPNTIINNIIICKTEEHGSRFGIFLSDINGECENFEIACNLIKDCSGEESGAIHIQSGNPNIHHNLIKDNYIGIDIEYASGNIHHNTLISNSKDATFIFRFDDMVSTKWYRNYWNRTRIAPKSIFGTIVIDKLHVPWMEFDWFPAIRPYDIPMGMSI